MHVDDLSESSQNYLKVIWGLTEWSRGGATNTAIADRVGLKVSTVSDAIRKLTDQDLVEHAKYGDVTLTAEGRRLAVTMVRRHRLIETFLVQVLHYRWDEVHDEAEVLEHAVSARMIERIDALLEHPTRDPHGDAIPADDGSVPEREAEPLASAAPGSTVRVARIGDRDPQLLGYLATSGIGVDAVVEIAESAPFSDTISVRTHDGRTVPLGAAAAKAVWVSPATDRA